jgi:hypothetical protein
MDLESLNVVFCGLFLKLWMVPFFSVGSVQLVTGIQLLSGHGTVRKAISPFTRNPTGTVQYGTVRNLSNLRIGTVRYLRQFVMNVVFQRMCTLPYKLKWQLRFIIIRANDKVFGFIRFDTVRYGTLRYGTVPYTRTIGTVPYRTLPNRMKPNTLSSARIIINRNCHYNL